MSNQIRPSEQNSQFSTVPQISFELSLINEIQKLSETICPGSVAQVSASQFMAIATASLQVLNRSLGAKLTVPKIQLGPIPEHLTNLSNLAKNLSVAVNTAPRVKVPVPSQPSISSLTNKSKKSKKASKSSGSASQGGPSKEPFPKREAEDPKVKKARSKLLRASLRALKSKGRDTQVLVNTFKITKEAIIDFVRGLSAEKISSLDMSIALPWARSGFLDHLASKANPKLSWADQVDAEESVDVKSRAALKRLTGASGPKKADSVNRLVVRRRFIPDGPQLGTYQVRLAERFSQPPSYKLYLGKDEARKDFVTDLRNYLRGRYIQAQLLTREGSFWVPVKALLSDKSGTPFVKILNIDKSNSSVKIEVTLDPKEGGNPPPFDKVAVQGDIKVRFMLNHLNDIPSDILMNADTLTESSSVRSSVSRNLPHGRSASASSER